MCTYVLSFLNIWFSLFGASGFCTNDYILASLRFGDERDMTNHVQFETTIAQMRFNFLTCPKQTTLCHHELLFYGNERI